MSPSDSSSAVHGAKPVAAAMSSQRSQTTGVVWDAPIEFFAKNFPLLANSERDNQPCWAVSGEPSKLRSNARTGGPIGLNDQALP